MAKGGKIANFFAEVGFKVNTKELKKVETRLKNLSKSFTNTAKEFERSAKKIERAFDKIQGPKRTSKVRPSKPADTGKFTKSGFFEKEGNLRSTMKLTERQSRLIRFLTARQEKYNVSKAVGNARVKEAIASMKRHNRQLEVNARRLKKASFVQERFTSSIKNFAGAYIGVFGAIRGFTEIKTIGQNLESAEAGMLSVTDSSKTLATDLAFVDKQAVRLGLDLVQTTKGFVKLKASAKEMNDEDLQGIFLGIAESGTVMQLSQDDIAGSIRARVCMAH